MGGQGSGRRSDCWGKSLTEESPAFDIRNLFRSGRLSAGEYTFRRWYAGGGANQKVLVTMEGGRLVLRHSARPDSPTYDQKFFIEHTPCHFGGSRPWLVCPGCSKRVAIIYKNGRYFYCGRCCKLSYPSQVEGVFEGSVRKAERIRKRLGWPHGILFWARAKPKGMHYETFERLKAEHDRLVRVCFPELRGDGR